jgi:hypothetical protein
MWRLWESDEVMRLGSGPMDYCSCKEADQKHSLSLLCEDTEKQEENSYQKPILLDLLDFST